MDKWWHVAHKMPKKASIEERIAWHAEHLKHCQCRTDYPEKLKIEMNKRGLI